MDHVNECGLPYLLNPARFLAVTQQREADDPSSRTVAPTSLPPRSMYQPNMEIEDLFSPLRRGVLSEERYLALYGFFLERINPFVTILDPHYHTAEHVVRHCTLTTAVCLVASWHDRHQHSSSQLSDALHVHFSEVCYPALLTHGYRSTEIVMALVLLVQYQPLSAEAADDRSWRLLGDAIRMATELDLNTVTSMSLQNQADSRARRARERAWLNLWLLEQSLSNQTGRTPFLSERGVVETSNWHVSPNGALGDGIIVAHVELRRLLLAEQDMIREFKSSSHLKYLIRRIHFDLQQWHSRWVMVEPHSKRAGKLSRE